MFEKKIIEVEIITSCFLEMELLCRRYNSHTRQCSYLSEDSGTYKKIRKPNKKELNWTDRITLLFLILTTGTLLQTPRKKALSRRIILTKKDIPNV